MATRCRRIILFAVAATAAISALIGCPNERGETNNADTTDTDVENDADAASGQPASVEVTPSGPEIFVGDTAELEGTVTDTAGAELDEEPVWTSSDPEVATVDDEGVVTVEAVGSAEVEAAVDGVSDSADVDVLLPPAVHEDFTTYESTEQLRSDPRELYLPNGDKNIEDVYLEQTESGAAMRYDFPARQSCGGETTGRSLYLNDLLDENHREIWLEVRARFGSNFHTGEPNNGGVGLTDVSGEFEPGEEVEFSGGLSTSVGGIQTDHTDDEVYLTLAQWSNPDGPESGETVTGQSSGATAEVATEHLACSANSDYKWLILGAGQGAGSNRFSVKHGVFGSATTSTYPGNDFSRDLNLPAGDDNFNSVEDFFDGQWHTYRMHWALEDPVDSDSDNGISRIWIDGDLVRDWTDLDTADHDSLGDLKLGANRNTPANEPMSIWWNDIRVWTDEPGW